jgi:hypothetical protein
LDKRARTRKRNKITAEIKDNMTKVGTYRKEFDITILRYVDMRIQYELMNDKWYESGCAITEEYVNKSGAKNIRKTALYMALESMRKDLTDMENILGLTPKGLKAIKAKGLDKGKPSKLEEALSELSK